MKIRFFTDPHIGLNRTSHTTPASRERLKAKLSAQVFELQFPLGPSTQYVCLGDLFDTFNVDNQSLLDGIEVFSRCSLTLFGNHDLSNRVDQLSSIQVADSVCTSGVNSRYAIGVPKADTTAFGIPIWWVDHKLNQGIFEGAIQDAFDQATEGSILLLHCNYDSPFATQESTLNLTRADAELLLTKFSYILIGHEHMPRTDFDGRLYLIGNTHPTGFSDISDKFCLDFEIENGKVTDIEPVLIWSENEGYLSLDWTELSDLISLGEGVQFLEVKGTAGQQHMPLIASQVANLWQYSDNLLMVRNSVITTSLDNTVTINESTRCQSIPERISTELAGTKLEPLWNSYLERL